MQTYTQLQGLHRFTTESDHLNALVGWLQHVLTWQIAMTRHAYGALADDENRGLYIPDAEIEILSAAAAPLPPELADQRAELAAERAAIAAHAIAAEQAGLSLPLLKLERLFKLTPFECDVLLLALAPELDLRYERFYAYIQDNVT